MKVVLNLDYFERIFICKDSLKQKPVQDWDEIEFYTMLVKKLGISDAQENAISKERERLVEEKKKPVDQREPEQPWEDFLNKTVPPEDIEFTEKEFEEVVKSVKTRMKAGQFFIEDKFRLLGFKRKVDALQEEIDRTRRRHKNEKVKSKPSEKTDK